jgi:predicted RNA-binding Zn-ribbon protein involved in translation (DUF1610 family)
VFSSPKNHHLLAAPQTSEAAAAESESAAVAAMEFCPSCGTVLQIDPGTGSHRLRFFCPICPYVCAIQSKVSRRPALFLFLASFSFSVIWCLDLSKVNINLWCRRS